jgi:hypothetical protein
LFGFGLSDIETMALDRLLKLDRDPVLEELERRRQAILSNRYLGPRGRVNRAPSRLGWLLRDLDDCRFRQEVRTTRTRFWQLVRLIEGHPIFHGRSPYHQQPVALQLLVALKRFGTFGNAAAVGCLASREQSRGTTCRRSPHPWPK